MNLWVKKLRQLTVLAVALFFFSCEDESSILGFKTPNKKFKVNFVDVPLESSVFLVDSLRTSNLFGVQGETNRLLVGHYYDDKFGVVTSTAITQFFTVNSNKALLSESAVFDSVTLQLRLDLYTYGSRTVIPQTVSIHELERALVFDSVSYYFNKSKTPYNPTPLGTGSLLADPINFDKFIADRKDTTISYKIRLDPSFGQRIFDSAVKYRNSTTPADSSFVRAREFSKEFKGLAIVPQDADKIVGISPVAPSRVILHYHDNNADSLELALVFTGMINYNQIGADRSMTAIAGLNQFSQPITPDDGLRYVQSGTGILTRIDFSNFYNFVDQDSNANTIVNSAELILGPTETSPNYPPINALSLVAMKGEGFIRKLADPKINYAQYYADSVSLTRYDGQLILSGATFTPSAPDGSVLMIGKEDDGNNYSGFLTRFAQQLFMREEGKERFKYFALFPESPPPGKSVNRLTFSANNIKLRVYYTRPEEPAQ